MMSIRRSFYVVEPNKNTQKKKIKKILFTFLEEQKKMRDEHC